MSEFTPSDRSRPDACPGALQVHQAADGALSRARIPGGAITPAQLQALADAARDLAGGEIELTSRGNVQVRAVTDPAAFAARLTAAGLLPSATHERVRNIVATPMSGRSGGFVDVRGWVNEVDTGLCADPDLADLPGRVLFTLDDGRGDVTALRGDIGLHAVTPTEIALILAGADHGVRLSPDDGVTALLDAARALREIRGTQWRLHEIEDGPAILLRRLGITPAADVLDLPDAVTTGPIGWIDQPDGTVTLAGGLRFGVLPARLADFLAAVDRPVTVTPWRSVLLHDLTEDMAEQVVRVLAPMGLIFDANSPWLQVSACAGQPGCAKSRTDVRADAARAVDTATLPADGRQHWAGCERRCGRPRGAVTDVVATDDGYRVDPPAP
ncbi:precorrin-3B synthase [Rhodococcus triatomae]